MLADKVTQKFSDATPLWQRVLVVEDVLAERARLVAMLTKQGFDVVQAENGAVALSLLEQLQVGLIISDWRMPVVDGMQLLTTLQAHSEIPPYFLLLTGQNAVCDLVAALDAGADDYIRKPFNGEELRARVQAGARIVRLRSQLNHRNVQLSETLARESKLRNAIQQDLIAAEQLQRSLLPSNSSQYPGLQFAHYLQSATSIGGDSYNVLPLTDTHVAFYHIDIAGHGARAAMQSFSLSRFLADPTSHGLCLTVTDEHQVTQPISPELIVAELNKRFPSEDECRNYFTMIYGVFDLTSGDGLLCQAGHPHPLQLASEGEQAKVIQLGQGGTPVGLIDPAHYESTAFQLQPGDKLLIYSDGILSCRLNNHEEMSTPQLMTMLDHYHHQPADTLCQTLIADTDKLLKGLPADDDISWLILERPPLTSQE
ncbi:SpoIIE family protein phosphatase [Amphritea sp. 1_MG-2023]|uniref:PP2C family protein-serine/threonine phosphatase n=1 Tax=Amphritea sp. 1_MG-2023 TaxID=3062670 RepID=UPI0026E265CC|nr:SpoIIE family protein phosphatase [Amphritea sp. 1_MG-2023]MDO6563780.1 SpoIIE family protein phosphatase [Amphritea sp. 1_MG-2023]